MESSLSDAFDMKALRIQALTYAARLPPSNRVGLTIGPDSEDCNNFYADLPEEPVTPCIPLDPRFNDSQWDYSICEDENSTALDTSMDLMITVQTVAQNMYLGEMEKLRREMVRQEMRKRLAAMEKLTVAYREKIEREADRDLQEKSQLLQQAFDARVKESLQLLADKEAQFAAEDQKRLQEVAKRKELKQDIVKRQAEKAKLNAYLDEIQVSQKEIRAGLQCYEETLAGLGADLKATIRGSFDAQLKGAIPQNAEIKLTADEVQKWKVARDRVDELIRAVQAQVQQVKVQASANAAAAAQAAEAAAAAAIERNRPKPVQPQPVQVIVDHARTTTTLEEGPNLAMFISVEAQALYSQVEMFARRFEEALRPLTGDLNTKRFQTHAKTAVVMSLTKITPNTLGQSFQDLSNLLSGAVVKVNNKLTFNSAEHPLGTRYLTMVLAQKLLDREYSSLLAEYATIIVGLAHRFPEFAQLFRYYVYQQFPTLVPYFAPQFEDQTIEEYKAAQGYKEGEPLQHYLDRVGDMTRLYAQVTITQPRRGETNPFPLETGWKWLADVLNMDPVEAMSVMIVTNYLEVAGQQLFRAYGRQFKRMVGAFSGPYLRKLKEIGGPQDTSYIVRYEQLMEKMARWQ